MARIGITALLLVAAFAPTAHAQGRATVVLMEREHHTRLGDALERELGERGIALERRYDPGGSPEARAAHARTTARELGAAAAVWVEEPEGEPPVVAIAPPGGEPERWPMATQAARVPPRAFALMAAHMVDDIVPPASKMTLEVEVERIGDEGAPGTVTVTETETETVSETVSVSEPDSGSGTVSETGMDAASEPPSVAKWRGSVGAIGSAHVGGASSSFGGGTRFGGGPRLGASRVRAEAFGWLAATDRDRHHALGAAGLALRLEPDAHLGVVWGANAALLVGRGREPVQQGTSPVRRTLGWRAGLDVGVRWRLSDALDMELAADVGAARLGRADVRFAPMVRLGLGLGSAP